MRPQRFVLLIAVGLLACESTSSPEATYEHTVTAAMLTGAALAALRADGHFDIQVPPTAPGQVSLAEAKIQALEFARYVTNHVLLRGVVEGERGGYWTDPYLLVHCGNPYFVHSQLGTMPLDTVAEAAASSFRRRFGPQWILPMCGADGEPQMTVQVALDGNSIRFANGEPIAPDNGLTTAWHARGVPLNWPDALSVSAERAVRFAYETFGVRVAEVPQLQFRGDVLADGRYVWYQAGSARFCHRWRVVMEAPVSVRSTTTTTTTDVVYVAAFACSRLDVQPQLHVPVSQQPGHVLLDFYDDNENPPREWLVEVPAAAPIRFEIGTPAR